MNTQNDTPETITIQLTQGQSTIISAVDADLAQLKWCAKFSRNYEDNRPYVVAMRSVRDHDGSQKSIYMHRVILERILGRPLSEKEFVDHINNKPNDNRRSNLRLATRAQNMHNSRISKNNTSGYKGVSWIKSIGAWRARISVNNKLIHLGCFNTPEDAHEAYCIAAKEYHGSFWNPG